MDYHERHGHDVCSFDLPSTHRMPTISAAQALEELNEDASRHVSTSLPDLDLALAGGASNLVEGSETRGGIQRGQVTEFWGPPGAGKTALGIQAAANTLREGKAVFWVDCFYPVCHSRIRDFYRTTPGNEVDGVTSNNLQEKLLHFTSPTLAHFIALLCRPTQSSLPADTALIVVDSLSALVNHAFPRTPPPKSANRVNSKGPSSASRRIQVLQYIVGALQKLAATRDAAVVVFTQCATRMQAEKGATLIPSINANVWEQGIATRVALFRDWAWNAGRASGIRLAAVQKANGMVVSDAVEKVSAFKIESTGLRPVNFDGAQSSDIGSTHKRKLDQAGFEVPDSEDEDYGWREDDDSALPRPPPQWQGSEDILLGTHPETDDDDSNADDAVSLVE